MSNYHKQLKKKIQILRAHLIDGINNKDMADTDRMNEDVAKYRITVHGKNGIGPFLHDYTCVTLHNVAYVS